MQFSALVFKTITHQSGLHYSHQFKLDKWVDDGPMIAAAFGSENLSTTNELHRVISIMIRNSPSSSILAGRGYSSDADSSK